jgi:hypothetical protein
LRGPIDTFLKPAKRNRRDVKQIAVFRAGPTILWLMLILFAFARCLPRATEHDGLEDEPRAALGHLGLTVIALVFVLLNFWKS